MLHESDHQEPTLGLCDECNVSWREWIQRRVEHFRKRRLQKLSRRIKDNDIRYPIGMAAYSYGRLDLFDGGNVSAETVSSPNLSCVDDVQLHF
jgi:hypothetical protein